MWSHFTEQIKGDPSLNLRKRVLGGLGWLAAASGSVQAIKWVSTIYVIRLLAPEDYGIVAISTVLFGLLTRICDDGFGNAIVVSQQTDERVLGEFLGFLLIVSTALAIIHFCAAPLLALFFEEPRIIPVVQMLSLGFIFTAISIIPLALVTKKMQFKRFAIANSLATLTGTAVTVVLAFNGYAFWALIVGQLANKLAIAIIFNFASRTWLLPRLPGKDTIHLISVGGSITAAGILWYVYTKLDVFIAGHLWNSTTLGYYTVPVHLARLPAGKVMPLLRRVAMPSFAEIRDNSSAVAYYFRRTFAIAALVSFPIFFGIASVAPTALPLILGDKWEPSVWLMFAVCLGMPFSTLIGLFGPILQATGNHKLMLTNTTIALSLFAVAFTLGALVGPLGLASAWAVSFPVIFVIVTTRSASSLGVRPREIYKKIGAPLAASVVMLAMNLLLEQYVLYQFQPVPILTMQILLGSATYFVALYLIDGTALSSAIRIMTGNRAKVA